MRNSPGIRARVVMIALLLNAGMALAADWKPELSHAREVWTDAAREVDLSRSIIHRRQRHWKAMAKPNEVSHWSDGDRRMSTASSHIAKTKREAWRVVRRCGSRVAARAAT